MNLWIYSQEKKMLLKVNDKVVVQAADGTDDYFIVVDDHIVGLFKSKERALEVLKDIYHLLRRDYPDTKVYEIPKE